jgi:hypothetical protein
MDVAEFLVEEYLTAVDTGNIYSIIRFCTKHRLCMACIAENCFTSLGSDGICSRCEEKLLEPSSGKVQAAAAKPPSPPKKSRKRRTSPRARGFTPLPTIPEDNEFRTP